MSTDRTTERPSVADVDLRAGRRRVARSRGVLSGVLLIILGAWAALVPFIGPYFDFGIEPRADDAWHWTSGRGLYELLPGGVAVLAGLLLLFSASRLLTVVAAWFAAVAGAWLVIGTTLADVINVSDGSPQANAGDGKIAAQGLLYFYATGAAITLVAGIALGRLSVHSVRDVRAAERRAEAEAAAEQQRIEHERAEHERAEHERAEHERLAAAEAARAEEQRRHDDTVRPDGADGRGPHDVVVAGDGRNEADHGAHRAPGTQDAEGPTTAVPAQQSPFTPDGPRDTAGSTGYRRGEPDGGQPGDTRHQPGIADRDAETREFPAQPQAYPPPQGPPQGPPPQEPRQR